MFANKITITIKMENIFVTSSTTKNNSWERKQIVVIAVALPDAFGAPISTKVSLVFHVLTMKCAVVFFTILSDDKWAQNEIGTL